MENKKDTRKLRNYIIKSNIQLKIALTNILHIFIAVSATVLIIMSPFIYDMFQATDLEVQYQAANMFVLLLGRLLIALLVVFVLVFLHQVVITHQVCGPIVNFTNTISQMAKGDLSRRVVLRKNDYLKPEARQINEMATKLSEYLRTMRSANGQLMEQLDTLFDRLEGLDDVKEVTSAVHDTKEQLHILNDMLDRFKLMDSANKETS